MLDTLSVAATNRNRRCH